MINIYTPESLLEAQCLKDMLASRCIPCHLAGVDLMGAVGELPAFGLLGLYVEAEDAAVARELIDEYLQAQPLPSGDE